MVIEAVFLVRLLVKTPQYLLAATAGTERRLIRHLALDQFVPASSVVLCVVHTGMFDNATIYKG